LFDRSVAPIRAVNAFDLAFQLSEPPSRLVEASDFVLCLLRQVRELAQYTTNRTRWCRRRKKMTLPRARVRGADYWIFN
jgi:hypothetical protein